MTDFEFEQYLTSFIKMYTTNLKKAMANSTPHKFSPKFERKMDILMGKSSKKSEMTQK